MWIALALLIGCPTGPATTDIDEDGYPAGEDCDDLRAGVHPGATELCNDRDDDCDGEIDEGATFSGWRDLDGDGFGDAAQPVEGCVGAPDIVDQSGDCDDTNASVAPGASELCNHIDDDCDGEIDEDVTVTHYADHDNDGFGDPSRPTERCPDDEAHGDVLNADDCDDNDLTVRPGVEEICDGIDRNCDGEIDNGAKTLFYRDSDGDGFGDLDDSFEACEPGEEGTEMGGDCDDTNAEVFPLQVELCNGIDDDCRHGVDDGLERDWYLDADGDGLGAGSVVANGCEGPTGTVDNAEDCDDTHPGRRTCDAHDDVDGDGFSAFQGDCADEDEDRHPLAVELPGDGLDQDCDGLDNLNPWFPPECFPAGTGCDPLPSELAAEQCGNRFDDDCDASTHCRPFSGRYPERTRVWTVPAGQETRLRAAFVVDLDGDGGRDLLWLRNINGKMLFERLDPAASSYESALRWTATASETGNFALAVVADVTGDGIVDVIAADGPALRVFAGPHRTGLGAEVGRIALSGLQKVAVGPITGRATPDLVLTVSAPPGYSPALVFQTPWTGTIGEADAFARFDGRAHAEAAIGDFDGDGRADLSVADAMYLHPVGSGLHDARWPEGDADGGSVAAGVAGDFNGDGRDELALSSGEIYRVGTGFRPAVPLARLVMSGYSLEYALAVDFDGDCASELVGGRVARAWWGPFEGERSGTVDYIVPSVYPTLQDSVYPFAPGDLDGDGFHDLIYHDVRTRNLMFVYGGGI